MADLTRDDLAELIALTAEANALQPGTQEHYAAMRRLDRAWGTLRDDRREAILALAAEALDRREGLVFGPWFGAGAHERYGFSRHDGMPYTIRRGSFHGVYWWWAHGRNASGPNGGECATEAEAIDAARAHDRARRGGR